ncbi:unnamed protein product [Linum trigynum]|uniref:Titin-like n=1 Tax=Linum trigynum TaxID=586398 RepID=A0AAV2F2C5_9ROSI
MASSEVEKIIEPVSITQEVQGVKSYLTPEVEAAVVSLAKSAAEGNSSSILEVPEGQADEPIAAKSHQVQHDSIEEAGPDAVVEDRVSPGTEAPEQISTPEICLVQNEGAAPETCLENGSKDHDLSSGVEVKELEVENEEATKSDMASSVENEVVEKGNVAVEASLQDEEKPAHPDDVKDEGVLVQEKSSIAIEGNEIAESAVEAKISNDKHEEVVPAEAETAVEKTLHSESHEEANKQNEAAVETEKHIEIAESAEESKISNDKPDEAVPAEAETVMEKTLHPESHEESNNENEAAVETEKHIESETRELEPAVAELVTKSAESETEAEKQEQVDEPDSKEALEIHNCGASKEVVQTEEAYDAKTPELETKSNHDDTVNKEGSSKEMTTVSDDDKVEEPVKESTVEDLQIDDQSASKEDIATPVKSDVAEKENAGQIGVQEEEKAADFADVRDNEVVLQEKTSNVTEVNETAESAEAKISDDKPDEAEKVESETVEKKPLHSEFQEEATYQQNEAPAETENHIGRESSAGEPITAELVTKNGETDAEKQEEIVQPESSGTPKVHHDAEASKEEVEVQTKEETSDAQKTELEPKSNEDDTGKEIKTNPTLGIDEAPEKLTVRSEDPTIHIVEKEVEIQKEEISKEDVKGDDAVDVIEEPVIEDTAEEIKIDDHSDSKEIIEEAERVDSSVEEPEKNEQSPEVILETPPDGEKEGQENNEKEEQNTEGVEDEDVPKKNESFEASEETIVLGVASPDDKKEEAEGINKETAETVDEPSPPSQGHESCDSTVQISVEKEEGSVDSETLGRSVESNVNSNGLEEVEEISNKETSKVAEEVEKLVIPVSSSEAEVNSSTKMNDDVAEEKTSIPKEDDKGDLPNESHATDTTEQIPVEDIQKGEETVEHSNREVLEQSETAAKVDSSSTPDDTEQNGEAVAIEKDPISVSNHETEQNAETKNESENSVEEPMQEPVKEGIVADLGVDDASSCKEIEQNEKCPEAALQTSTEGENLEALPMEEEETEKGETKNDGIAEEEVENKTEQGETVERAIEVPQVDSEDAEVVQEGSGGHSVHETEQKPIIEASEESNVVLTPQDLPEDDKKEEVVESNKEATETVDEPETATQDHGSLESEFFGVEEVAEISKEAPKTGEVTEKSEVISSSKVDDVVQEKVDIPEEESHALESIEPSPIEDLHKDEQKVELSSEEVLEQYETAAEVESSSTAHETEQDDEVVTEIASTIEVKTEVPETDEIIEKETLKGEEVESVLQEEKEQETRTSAEENPEELVTEHEITMKDQPTEVSGEIQTKDDELPVVEKEVPEIIQSGDEYKELENTMEEKEESTKEIQEPVVVEPVLGEEGEKEGVSEEKESVEPEAVEAIDTTKQGNLIEEVKESISSTESDTPTGSNEQTESVAAIIQAAPTLDKETLVEETTVDENTMVKGTEKPLVASSATATVEDSEGTSKEETIEEDYEERKQISDEFGESRLPAAGILESAAMQEEEVKGNVESVVAESEAIPEKLTEEKHVVQSSELPSHEDDHEEKKQPFDEVCESRLPAAGILESAAMQEEEVKGNVESALEESKAVQEQLPEEKHVVKSSEVPAHEDDYETKAVIENTEEEETKNVLVSQPDTPHDPLELQTIKDTFPKEMQPREFESEASTENKPVEEQDKEEGASQTVEEQINEASEGVETTTEDKLTDEKSIKEVKAEEQHQEEPPSLLEKEEEEKESSIETEEVKDELPQTEPETEGESCSQEQLKSPEDAVKEEVSVSDEMDKKQEASDSTGNEAVKDDEVPAAEALPEEPEVLQDEPKHTEEECKPEEVEKENQVKDEVEALVEQDNVEKQVWKSDDISGGETTATTEDTSSGISEDKSKQAEEEPVEQQEARELDVTTQVDPQVEEDVQEYDEVQKGDDAAVATEETKEVSALTTIAGEAIRPVEQVSREFQVSELEPEVEKGSQESEGSAITEETELVSQDTKPLDENETTQPENSPVEKLEEEHHEVLETSKPVEETLNEAKEMEDEASLIKEEPIVGQQKEGQEEKEEASEPASNFEFPGFIQPKELEQQVTTECPSGSEEIKVKQEKTVDINTVINKETLNSASEGSSQAVITKPVDNAVNENQPEGSEAELAIKEKEIIQESKPESEQKAEGIPEEEIEPKESGNEEVSREKESIPSECDVKIAEEEAKVKTEERKAEATTLIDKELCTEISQRDLPVELVEEATSEKQISTEAKPSAADETINPAKVSLFDMMAKSTRERQVVLEPTEEKEPQPAVTRDETKAAEAQPEKAKSDNEKEHDEEHEAEEQDEGEDQHKNDSGSDGMVIVEASKEAEVKVVTTPQKKSHNILSEVGSKVKHSISKVRKVITGKSSHQSKQKFHEQNSPK